MSAAGSIPCVAPAGKVIEPVVTGVLGTTRVASPAEVVPGKLAIKCTCGASYATDDTLYCGSRGKKREYETEPASSKLTSAASRTVEEIRKEKEDHNRRVLDAYDAQSLGLHGTLNRHAPIMPGLTGFKSAIVPPGSTSHAPDHAAGSSGSAAAASPLPCATDTPAPSLGAAPAAQDDGAGASHEPERWHAMPDQTIENPGGGGGVVIKNFV